MSRLESVYDAIILDAFGCDVTDFCPSRFLAADALLLKLKEILNRWRKLYTWKVFLNTAKDRNSLECC